MRHSPVARRDARGALVRRAAEEGAGRSGDRGDMSEEHTSHRALPMRGVPQPSRAEALALSGVHVSRHPVVAHKMGLLRDRQTSAPDFYRLVRELGTLLAYEATTDLQTQPVRIETPLEETTGQRLIGGVGIVPILRA